MNQNKKRDWIYFLVLVVVTALFVVAGAYWTHKDKNGDSSNNASNSTKNTDGSQINPENPASNTELTTDQQLYARGIKSLDAKDYDSAIHYFSQAIILNPDNTSYYSLKSEAEFLAGKKSDAKATLEAGLKVDPGNELLNSKLDVLNKDYFHSSDFDTTRE